MRNSCIHSNWSAMPGSGSHRVGISRLWEESNLLHLSQICENDRFFRQRELRHPLYSRCLPPMLGVQVGSPTPLGDLGRPPDSGIVRIGDQPLDLKGWSATWGRTGPGSWPTPNTPVIHEK